MDSLKNPVGPEAPSVYWRRRALVIGGVILVAMACMTVVSVVGRAFFSHPILGDVRVRQAIAQVIQANLKDVGIDVKFDTQEAAAWTKIWRTGQWEAVVGGWLLTGVYVSRANGEFDSLNEEVLKEARK